MKVKITRGTPEYKVLQSKGILTSLGDQKLNDQ